MRSARRAAVQRAFRRPARASNWTRSAIASCTAWPTATTDHEALVVNHSVTAGSSVGVRWYELRPSGSTLNVFQQGTYAPDSTYRWMGSIAMDKSGDMVLGFSTSSSSLHPGLRYSGRLASDAAGTMPQGESTIFTGPGSQTGQNLSRWGDYSEMTVDPA